MFAVVKVARRVEVSKRVLVGVGFAAVPTFVKVLPKPLTKVVKVVPPAGIIIDTRLKPKLAWMGVSTPDGPTHFGITRPAMLLA